MLVTGRSAVLNALILFGVPTLLLTYFAVEPLVRGGGDVWTPVAVVAAMLNASAVFTVLRDLRQPEHLRRRYAALGVRLTRIQMWLTFFLLGVLNIAAMAIWASGHRGVSYAVAVAIGVLAMYALRSERAQRRID